MNLTQQEIDQMLEEQRNQMDFLKQQKAKNLEEAAKEIIHQAELIIINNRKYSQK